MLYLILVSIMIFISVSLSGLLAPPFPKNAASSYVPPGYSCCDTGNKENCKAQRNFTVEYDGATYALLKSDSYLFDYGKSLFDEHMDPAQPDQHLGPNNARVFLNRGNKQGSQVWPECRNRSGDNDRNRGYDRLYGRPDPRNKDVTKPGCYKIKDELLIYLCRDVDNVGACDGDEIDGRKAKFDIYIRLKDVDESGIPGVITDCYKPPVQASDDMMIEFRPSPEGQDNLQLRTFRFLEKKPQTTWLSPYCKPAVYLYPERQAEINVSVYPKGKMLLTIPPYPKLGWDVVADPNGMITYQNARYDYLYYEASIPDELITKPKEGYVMPYADRETFLRNLVVQLGLNEKETQQFVEYWVPALPKSPYYFVGIVPVSNLNAISPLLITPKPDNIIRVTVYFQPLNEPISVDAPILAPVTRTGFTAVEWGGIFKRDKEHPFTCFM